MPWIYSRLMLIGLALSLVASGCSGFEETRKRQEAALAKCSFACNASGVWVFDDGVSRWVADIWMEPDGLHVKNRDTEAVRFYRTISLDNYGHEDGEVLEFKTNELMIRHLVSGREVVQGRLKS